MSWSPDGRVILFGATTGDVQAFSGMGEFMHRVSTTQVLEGVAGTCGCSCSCSRRLLFFFMTILFISISAYIWMLYSLLAINNLPHVSYDITCTCRNNTKACGHWLVRWQWGLHRWSMPLPSNWLSEWPCADHAQWTWRQPRPDWCLHEDIRSPMEPQRHCARYCWLTGPNFGGSNRMVIGLVWLLYLI